MVTNTLRARIEAALQRHVHNGHLVDAELDDVLDAVMSVVEAALQYAHDFSQGRCRHCEVRTEAAWNLNRKPRPHRMHCALYVGPVDHKPGFAINGSSLYGSNVRCSCGTHLASMADVCPNAAEVWRGPMPAREDVQ